MEAFCNGKQVFKFVLKMIKLILKENLLKKITKKKELVAFKHEGFLAMYGYYKR